MIYIIIIIVVIFALIIFYILSFRYNLINKKFQSKNINIFKFIFLFIISTF
jgi:hypothetical protein